jgi:hypothetical protein
MFSSLLPKSTPSTSSSSVFSTLSAQVANESSKRTLSQKYGSTTTEALVKRGISPTTTLASLNYFSNISSYISGFFTYILLIISPPYSMTTIIIFVLIILGIIIIFGPKIQEYLLIQKFTNYTNELSSIRINTNNRINSLIDNNTNNTANMTENADYKLINIQPLCFKQTSYLGSNFLDSNQGILDQLRLGSRFFFLQIDYHSSNSLDTSNFGPVYEPRLFWKNNAGDLTSKNSSKLVDVFKSIKEYKTNDTMPSHKTPIVLLLHFVRLPYPLTEIDNYKNYLKKVNQAITEELEQYLVNGYLRASNESNLFNNNFNDFNNKIIIGTNIDTSLYNGSIELDLKTHFHYYVKEGEIVDVTMPQTSDNIPNAYIFNSNTLLTMNTSTRNQWLQIYRNKFIIVKPSNEINLSSDDVNTLLNTFNVNVILHDYFSDILTNTRSIYNLYNKKSFKIKTIF